MATTAQRAVIGLLMAVALEDGDFDEEEFKILVRVVPDHPLFEGMSNAELKDLRSSVFEELQQGGDRATIAHYARSVPPELALQAFKLILDVMYADGVVDDSEGTLVVRLCGMLGISDSDFSLAVERAKRRAGY